MALSSAMYAAVTGLSALGTGMQTISNNIANVNTVGFKTMRTNYEDLISQNYYSGGKVNQRGTGVRVSTIQSMFTQGAFMSSAQDTDMAICGEGFFAVRNHVTNSINYTRAGVFTLTKDGYMEDPAGNILQGWQLSIPKPGQAAVRIGAPQDIKLTVLNAPPAATTEIKIVTNLDADSDPVYQYKQHQLSFDYADGIAKDYAEKAKEAAIFNRWNEFCEEVSLTSGLITVNAAVNETVRISSSYVFTNSIDLQNYYGGAINYLLGSVTMPATAGSAITVFLPVTYTITAPASSGMVFKTSMGTYSAHTVTNFTPATDTVTFNISVSATSNGSGGFTSFTVLTNGYTVKATFTSAVNFLTPVSAQTLTTAFYNSAKVDFTSTSSIIFDRNFLNTYVPYALGGLDNAAVAWLTTKINGDPAAVLEALSSLVVVNDSGLDWPPLPQNRIIDNGADSSPRYYFQIGANEISQFNIIATDRTMQEAVQEGETVYATTYAEIFKARTGIIEAYLPEWKLEGLGFAAAWDARDLDGDGQYIDATGMMVEGITIYDSLGAEHQLMIYYQKNPHMDNVWDYIITCDPLEDARKDSNNHLLLSDTARFSGLIQKGKITFTGDGTDRHGGVIKDIEAQNLDLRKCKMATIEQPTRDNGGWRSASTYTMENATIGGYYTGSPKIDPVTGNLVVDDRTYDIFWGGINTKKFQADENKWQSAFGVAMDYLYNNSARSSARLSTTTKFDPDDSMLTGKPKGTKPTWEDYFENLWNTASAAVWPVAVRDEIRGYLPYASFPAQGDDNIPWGGLRPKDDYIDPANGRTSLYWSGNVDNDPPTSGFTWFGSDGSSGTVLMTDKNYIGPYAFGSGLTITFDPKDRPLRFGLPGQDGLNVKAHSEQIAWVNLEPNKSGVYDFDVAFVNSASMALHPPYPGGMPTITQHISFDMGARNPNGLLPAWKVDKDMSTTQYAGGGKGNATLFRGQDGHAAGSLQRLSISEDGIVTGVYTNGFQLPLYQIGLTRFLNPWGLSKLGDNLFAETRYSGAGAMNEPGNAGTGTVLANFLEQSNVDVAEEIVNMILTQRGFQANSKTVTTVDTMLAEVIEMKR